jgi:hypothetical protein
MQYIVAAMIAALTATASYGQDIHVHSWGNDSCGKYLAAVYGHRPGAPMGFSDRQQGQFYDGHTIYMAWLGGFLSATNMWVTQDPNGIKDDKAAIDVWVRKWCEQNPTKPLVEAAWEFVWDQRREYLEQWLTRRAR